MEQDDKFTPEERAAQKLYWKLRQYVPKRIISTRELMAKVN